MTFAGKSWIRLAVAAVAAASAVVYGVWSVATHWPTGSRPSSSSAGLPTAVLRHIAAGVRLPTIESAAEAKIDADDEVVGVAVNGRARAYRLEAMSHIRRHVLNDVIDGRPVTVTYCDITDCVLVLSDDERREPLDIDIGGTSAGLFLFVDGEPYDQKTGLSARTQQPLPLEKLTFERTSWERWLREHPDSGVYAGQ